MNFPWQIKCLELGKDSRIILKGHIKKKRMKYPLHQSIHNEITGANFPGSLRNKGTTTTEVLHHTVSELEDTIHVLDPFSLLYMWANWGRIKSRSLVKVSWLLKYQIKSVKYLLSSSYIIPGGEVWGCPWPLHRADWNKERWSLGTWTSPGYLCPGGGSLVGERRHPERDEVAEKTSASHFHHVNRTRHGWINAALSAVT